MTRPGNIYHVCEISFCSVLGMKHNINRDLIKRFREIFFGTNVVASSSKS